jgi:hypothetical protein
VVETTDKGKLTLRRMFDGLSRKERLVPYLEAAMRTRGFDAWPEEMPVKVYNKEREYDGMLHPSTHAAMPELQLYHVMHPEMQSVLKWEPWSIEGMMRVLIGSAGHALLQNMLIWLGFCEESECEVRYRNEDLLSTGQLDWRRVVLPDGTALPVDAKFTGWLPKDEPKPAHALQMQIYMDIGMGPYGPAEEGLIVYSEMGGQYRMREFTVRRDEAVLKEVYGRWRRVTEMIATETPPTQIPFCCSRNTKDHLRCPARFVCPIGPPELKGR